MTNLKDTTWRRKADDTLFAVDADPEAASGRSNRSLRMRNTTTGRSFWGTPEGLSRKYEHVPMPLAVPSDLDGQGVIAAQTINEFLTEKGLTEFGGGSALYSPAAWIAREEEYGTDSHLIITHDGGAAAMVFGLIGEVSETLRGEFDERLKAHGMFTEACTSWYSAIYSI